MIKVEFKFSLDQQVETNFGSKGIITMFGYDEAGKKYWVETGNSRNNAWVKEKHLKPVSAEG